MAEKSRNSRLDRPTLAGTFRHRCLGARHQLANQFRMTVLKAIYRLSCANDSPRSMVKLAVEEIGRGSQLVVFPEGTRTVRLPVNRFKPGFALIAKRAGVPVQTVFIETISPFLCRGWRWWRRPRFPIRYRLRPGRRFMVEGDAKAFSAMLQAYFEHELRGSRPRSRDG